MTYDKQTWVNGSVGQTPISGARLTHMEDGVAAANNALDAKADLTYVDGRLATKANASALAGKADLNHSQVAATISDATTVGRAVLTATDAAAARTAIGAAAAGHTHVPTIRTVTSDTTLVITDEYLRVNSANAQTVTFPINSVVAIPVGKTITIRHVGAGALSIAAVSSAVTLNGALTGVPQNASYLATKVATDEWDITVSGVTVTGSGATTPTTTPPASSTSARLTKTNAGMVQRSGVNWRTGGFNIFTLATNDYGGTHIQSHAEIDSILDKAVTMKAYFVRAHTLGISIGDQPYHLVAGVSGTTTPVISYRAAVWEAIDYAIAGAASRGIYLMVPMTDELGYYHGGRRQWVNFRRPGTCSTDFNVKAANSSTERAAEGYFYTDAQIKLDFKTYISDWLNHVNTYTGRANKDEPAVAFIETGNELWTSVQDAPTWCAEICQHIKSVAPNVLTADGGGTDGQSLNTTSLASQYVDVFSTHPYSTYGPNDVTNQAIQAAASGKAYLVGEYPWSKAAAPNIEAAARAAGNCFTSAPWSLQNDADLHNNGAAYGTDDVSFYVPGKDATQTAAVARLQTHAQSLIDSASGATAPQAAPDTTGSGVTDSFTGTNGDAPDTTKWAVYPSAGSSATIQSNAARLVTGTQGGYGDKVAMPSKASARVNQRVTLDFTPATLTEGYFQVVLRSSAPDGSMGDVASYRAEVSIGTGYLSVVRRGANPTDVGAGFNVPGWAAGVQAHLDFAVIGSTVTVTAWTGSTKPLSPQITATNTDVTSAGYNGVILNGGGATTAVTVTVDNYALTNS